MLMPHEQNVGQNNKYIESVANFSYFGTTLILIREGIKDSLNGGGGRRCLLTFGSESFVFLSAIYKR
jgi:hypothetical protein